MSIENKISFSLSPENAASVQTSIDAISAILQPLLIALTPEQRKTIPKMNDKSLPFVQKALEYTQTNPEFAPPFINLPELKIDVEAVETLTKLERALTQLVSAVEDTAMLSGSEAYITSLAYYNSVKLAARNNIPAAQIIYDDLSKRFDGQKGSKNNIPSVKEPAANA